MLVHPYVTITSDFGLSKASNAPHKNSSLRLFWITKTSKQEDFYELYAIQKFGPKKNCMSEDKLVSAPVMNLKNKAID